MKPALAKNPSWEIKQIKSPVDKISIRYAVRLIEGANRWVLFLNGRSEFIEKYQDLPDDTDLRDANWIMMDHRGQGGSEGLRSHVSSYEVFARDASAVVKETIGDKPYLIIAHSMGGLISLYGTMTETLKPSALILCSPLFGIHAPLPMGLARPLARLIAKTPFASRATGSKVDRRAAFEGNILTRSPERFEKMASAQHRGTSPTFGWVHATFEAFATIYDKKRLKKLTIPVSIIVGEEEKVVDRMVYAAWIKTREELNGAPTPFKLVPGAHHELLNEADQYRDIAIEFINQASTRVR